MTRPSKKHSSAGMNLFQRALKTAVDDFGSTGVELGHRMGLNYSASSIVSGCLYNGTMPLVKTIARLEHALGLPMGYLYNLMATQIINVTQETICSKEFQKRVEQRKMRMLKQNRELYHRRKQGKKRSNNELAE